MYLPNLNTFGLSGRYTCNDCSKYNKKNAKGKGDKQRRKASFNAGDPGVLARLDSYVSNAFPFVLTHKSGVAKTVVARLGDDLLNGKGFSATSKFMREAYMNSYMMQYHSYVSLVNRCRRSIGGHFRAAAEEGAPDIPTFGGFGDKEGFNGAWPSDQYLRAVWHKWFSDTVVIEVCRFVAIEFPLVGAAFWCLRGILKTEHHAILAAVVDFRLVGLAISPFLLSYGD
ncbi:unnamed protein product [Ectocarpus sp. 12 AP-2014]